MYISVFVYLCVCVFVYLHLHVRQLESLFLKSLYHQLFKNIAHVVSVCIFDRSCICVFVYLYLGNEEVVVGQWVVDFISFQKIFGLCSLECHMVEIWRDVTLVDRRTTNGGT